MSSSPSSSGPNPDPDPNPFPSSEPEPVNERERERVARTRSRSRTRGRTRKREPNPPPNTLARAHRPIARALALGLLLLAPAAQGAEGGRRWALVVGENAGAGEDEPLRYAERDAQRLLEVLQEVGSVAPATTLSLYGANATRVRQALAELSTRLAREGTRADQLILYISSHADEGALHLAGTRLPVSELTDFLARAPVGVALLVLDSCRSGAVTRLKGLKPLGGSEVRVDAASVEGRVILSSSGPDELAQESEELQGSFFTHHLVAALRGAADRSGDGRVTLEEAYGYAYARTVESTFATRGGMQRPSYRVGGG